MTETPADPAREPLPADHDPVGDGRLRRGGVAWAIFEGGRNPYVILITIYVFMPYVAGTMVGDAVRGQEVISRWAQYSGWTVMATAPFLGASVDRLGRRKTWLALLVALMVPIIAGLWWAKPDGSGLSVAQTMLLATTASVLFTWSEVLHNALLVRAAGLSAAHKASGLGLALGNFTSVLALVFTACAFALPGKVHWSFVPAAPLFGLDTAQHEPQRVVALLSAGLLALGSLPLFLFTPDAPPTGVPLGKAVARSAGDLVAMIRTVRRHRDAAIYLLARMLFVDGMGAILNFIGVYAVGVMKWGGLEMLAFGVLLSVLATAGGFVGRALDQRLGPRRALQIEIVMAMIALIAVLGTSPRRILFAWSYDAAAHPALWGGPVFKTLPDLVFVLIGFVGAVFITAQYASARTMLTRLTPPEQSGSFFGVYALSGVATGWLAPMLVNLGTGATHSQQGGMATIIVLLSLGFLILARVRGGGPFQRQA